MKFITITNILAKCIFTLLVFVFVRIQSDYILVPIFNSLGSIVISEISALFSCITFVFVHGDISSIPSLLLTTQANFIFKLSKASAKILHHE